MTEACDITNRPPSPDQNPEPEQIRAILETSKNIAIVGLSPKPGRASGDVGMYLKDHGYNVIPVNPAISLWEGVKAYASVADIPGRVDVVDIFRKPEAINEMVDDILAIKPVCAWFQLGIVNNEAAARLRNGGVTVVQDRCMKIEHASLVGG